MAKGNFVFTVYYGPKPSPKFYHRGEGMPKRVKHPWMVAVSTDDDHEWAPGVQRTLVGAIWATWRQYRRMR
jgi:hypothetical protein